MNEIQESSSSQLPLSPSLQKEVDELESLHLEIIDALITSFDKAVELGKRLTNLKDRLPHGKFLPFIEQNIKTFKPRAAQNYMRIYKNEPELRLQLHEKLDIGLALKFLAKKKPKEQTAVETKVKKTIDEHTQKVNIIIRKFNSLEKKGVEKALEYFSENQTDKDLLLEAVSDKKAKTLKSIDDQLNQISRMIDRLRKKKYKLNKTKKERQRYDRIENLFR